ncbi:hypothetical protein J5226_08515 [Lysobacter sp. K5869]|uniref:hypothetical protein n=1 Tax=Lysobacter sp. K5869 TaxID=2820808 RepID=UPI001C05FC14|nr:hypothetical protein [Lysobacter sp. K5869]QWP78419.1 hypothetical protein J5226_08515 [Lysobacter sp. K5869]
MYPPDYVEFFDPMQFRLWVKIDPGKVVAASAWYAQRYEGSMSAAAFYRDCRDAVQRGDYVGLHEVLHLREVPDALDNLPDFAVPGSAILGEEPIVPDAQTPFCETHGILFTAGQGCAVCDDPVWHRMPPGLRERLQRGEFP